MAFVLLMEGVGHGIYWRILDSFTQEGTVLRLPDSLRSGRRGRGRPLRRGFGCCGGAQRHVS